MHAKKRVQSQEELLRLSERLIGQKKHDKHKLYRCRAPEGACISQGEAHKKHECGCNVSVAATLRDNWIFGINAHHCNPYESHTLTDVLTQIQHMAGSPEMRPIDTIAIEVIPAREIRISLLHGTNEGFQSSARCVNSCGGEALIGHMKSYNRMDRSYLKGKEGDTINDVLCGRCANIGKLIKAFFLLFGEFTKIHKKMLHHIKITGIVKGKQGIKREL